MDGSTRESRTTWWVDNLCAFAVLRLLTRSPFSGSTRIRFIRSTMIGRLLSTLLFVPLAGDVKQVGLERSLGDFRTPEGANLVMEAEYAAYCIGKRAMGEADNSGLGVHRLGRRYRQNLLELYLRRSIGIYVLDRVKDLLMFRAMVREMDTDRTDVHVFMIRGAAFHEEILSEVGPLPGAQVETYFDARGPRAVAREMRALGRLASLTLRQWAEAWSGKHGEQEGAGEGSSKRGLSLRPRVGVQMRHGTDLTRRNDFSWYAESGLAPDQIFVYDDKPGGSLSPEDKRTLDEMGIEWASVSGWWPSHEDAQYRRDSVGTLAAGLRLALSAATGSLAWGWWQWGALVSMERKVGWWNAFYRRYRIRVHTRFSMMSPSEVHAALAMEQAGGVSLAYQRSSSEYLVAATGRVMGDHVFFTWGSLFEDQMKSVGEAPDVLLIGGGTYAKVGSPTRAAAAAARQRLVSAGCDYVISAFDSSYGGSLHQTRRAMVDFYRDVLGWVLEDPRLGLIIKPKYTPSLKELGEIRALLDKAVRTERCLVMDWKTSTMEAALASDLAVAFGINTAAFEAALVGVPAVHLDNTAMTRSPLHAEGLGNFVFTDATELWDAITRKRSDPDGQIRLGDYGPYLAAIDPFLDGEGSARIGRFIRCLMDGFEHGGDREAVLAEAASRYARDVGKEYVEFADEGSRR